MTGAAAAMLSMKIFAIVWTGSFIGALAAGGAGFAFALAASSIWLHALDPLHTTAFVVASGTLLHTGFVWQMRSTIAVRRLTPFLIGAFVGIPLGIGILAHSDGRAMKEVLGVFLLAYGLYALLSPQLPPITWGGRAVDGTVGFIGGLLGGLGGFSGVLPTIWTQMRGWSKEEARGVYQPYILVVQIATLLLLGGVAFDTHHALLFLSTVPFLLLGAWIGWRIYGRLDDRRFKQILAILITVSGGTLAF